MDNTLPGEMVAKIKKDATNKSYEKVKGSTESVYGRGFRSGYEVGHEDAATEYATKLLQVEQCNTDLRVTNTKQRTLLEKFMSRHEAGLLPDMFIYKEIKNFLDGK